MELRKLGDQHKKQCCKVDGKVTEFILCVETGEEESVERKVKIIPGSVMVIIKY